VLSLLPDQHTERPDILYQKKGERERGLNTLCERKVRIISYDYRTGNREKGGGRPILLIYYEIERREDLVFPTFFLNQKKGFQKGKGIGGMRVFSA